jgi:hypothetical protein
VEIQRVGDDLRSCRACAAETVGMRSEICELSLMPGEGAYGERVMRNWISQGRGSSCNPLSLDMAVAVGLIGLDEVTSRGRSAGLEEVARLRRGQALMFKNLTVNFYF